MISSVISAAFRFNINLKAFAREKKIVLTFDALQDDSRNRFTSDYLSIAVAKHLQKVKSERS